MRSCTREESRLKSSRERSNTTYGTNRSNPLVLTYDLRSVDQTTNDSSFYVMWVVGLEVKITTSMSRLPVHFCGQFWTPLHNQHVREWKGIFSLNFHSEFYGRPNVVNMLEKFL
jgi:hypothetical protein